MSKQKTQASHRVKITQQKALLERQSKLIAAQQAKLVKVTKSLEIQKRKNTILLSDAPDIFDLMVTDGLMGQFFVKKGQSGWLYENGKPVSAFRMTEDGIVEQLSVVDNVVIPSTRIKEIMEG